MNGRADLSQSSPTDLEKQIWDILEEVKDPEVPVLSVVDLGVVRNVSVGVLENNQPAISLTLTPTYSGCPAMDTIRMDTRLKLIEHGFRNVVIKEQLSPAWTTDWMTEQGKRKLEVYGIAPPRFNTRLQQNDLFHEDKVACPRCGSSNTELLSEFASTACKSMYRCLDCKEPFDYFKCH